MTAIDRIQASLEKAEGQESYLAWLASPWTQEFIAAGRELARPGTPQQGLTTDYLLGLSVGANGIVDFICTPRGILAEKKKAIDRLKRNYGAVEDTEKDK